MATSNHFLCTGLGLKRRSSCQADSPYLRLIRNVVLLHNLALQATPPRVPKPRQRTPGTPSRTPRIRCNSRSWRSSPSAPRVIAPVTLPSSPPATPSASVTPTETKHNGCVIAPIPWTRYLLSQCRHTEGRSPPPCGFPAARPHDSGVLGSPVRCHVRAVLL